VVTPDRFAETGRALYGDKWQSDTARSLGVNDRTVRRWLVEGVPDWVDVMMARLVSERALVLERLQETQNDMA